MARKAKVNYWASRGGYGCWHKGHQVILEKGPKDEPFGPTYNAAVKKFAALQREEIFGPSVGRVIDEYLEWVKAHRSTGTLHIRECQLSAIKDGLGDKPACVLDPLQFDQWCAAEKLRRNWADGTVWLTMVSFQTCLNWAVKHKVIDRHCLREMELPECGARGQEYALSPEQQRTVIEAARGATREFVQALRDTGARPGEICHAEARHYDPRIRALVFEARVRRGQFKHKTSRTGKPRVIYLSGETLANVERLMQENPTGPLFLTALRRWKGPYAGKRGPWTVVHVREAFKWLRRKTGLENLIAYSFRHTYAVQWLRAGRPVDPLAEVMGTSVLMLRRHYGHLADQHDYLRRLVDEQHEQRDHV